jgi:hypothetical protein
MMTQLRTRLSIILFSLFVPALASAQTAAPSAPRMTLGITAGHAAGSGPLFSATRTSGSRSGAALDISGRVAGRFGLAAEAGLFDAASFLAGARWSPGVESRGRAFVQVLVGPTKLTLERSALTVQPGAGVDFVLSPAVGFRLQVDFRNLTSEGYRSHQIRFVAGVVFSSRD